MSGYKVGQQLYWEPYDSRDKRHSGIVQIMKVGRVWLELSNGYRVSAKTLIADGKKYASQGRCFLDKSAREAEVTADALWSALRAKIYLRIKTVSADDIHAAAKLLGVAI